VCSDANTLQAYASTGTCAPGTGMCSYSYGFVSCASGCANGACNASGWKIMKSNTTSALYNVWGASASSVWAVGRTGTIVHYDGTQWQVQKSPPAAIGHDLYAIHGSSASNVFLVANTTLLRFDGANWNTVLDLSTVKGFGYVTGIYATGDAANDVYVSMMNYNLGNATPSLYTVDNTGTATLIGSGNETYSCYSSTGGVWPVSSTDVVFASCTVKQWDGSKVNDMKSAVALPATPASTVT
jgi:hypothetical protein